MPPLLRVRRAAVRPAAALTAALTPDERARVSRAAPADQDAVATSLPLARRAVAEACGVDPDAVRIRRRCPRCGSTDHGVPRAERADDGPVPHLSLTRTTDLVVVALGDVPDGHGDARAGVLVGVDVERAGSTGGGRSAAAGLGAGRAGSRLGTDAGFGSTAGLDAGGASGAENAAPGFGAVVLAPGEVPAAGPDGLLRTWVRKEAVLKAAGTGLSVDPRTLTVSDATGHPHVTTTAAAAPPRGTRWWLADLDLGTPHVAALAAAFPLATTPTLDVR